MSMIGAVGTSMIGGLALAFLMDDDRPPIIVKNRKLVFETDEKAWKTKSDGRRKKPATLRAEKWTTQHLRGRIVRQFVVSIYGGGADCDTMRGTQVELQYRTGGQTISFTVGIEDGKPIVLCPVPMVGHNSGRRKRLHIRGNPDGSITSVTVTGRAGGRCDFSGKSPVLIELCMHDCD